MNDPQTPLIVEEDDIAGELLEVTAAQARQAAYHAAHAWRGVPLKKFSIGREALYHRLRGVDAPVPLQVMMQHPAAFLGDAVKILYLCHHEPEQWQPLLASVPRFLQAIDEWAEAAIPRSLQSEAVTLALRILNEGTTTEAVPEPARAHDEERAGN